MILQSVFFWTDCFIPTSFAVVRRTLEGQSTYPSHVSYSWIIKIGSLFKFGHGWIRVSSPLPFHKVTMLYHLIFTFFFVLVMLC